MPVDVIIKRNQAMTINNSIAIALLKMADELKYIKFLLANQN